MGKDAVYLPVIHRNGMDIPCGTPFLFTKDAKIIRLKADTNTRQSMRLVRKHPFLGSWQLKMTGACFQGANRADFSDAKTLYTVDNDPDFYYSNASIKSPESYRYYRYIPPSATRGHLAELEFYEGKDSMRIYGEMIGTQGSNKGNPSRTVNSIFDGDVLTFFEPPTSESFVWAGMDFGKKVNITKIRYLPRNDDNIIIPGQDYELFYWGDDGWKSLGWQTATEHVLYYDDAPQNALFLLRNLSKGIEERIFTYENDKQVWW